MAWKRWQRSAFDVYPFRRAPHQTSPLAPPSTSQHRHAVTRLAPSTTSCTYQTEQSPASCRHDHVPAQPRGFSMVNRPCRPPPLRRWCGNIAPARLSAFGLRKGGGRSGPIGSSGRNTSGAAAVGMSQAGVHARTPARAGCDAVCHPSHA